MLSCMGFRRVDKIYVTSHDNTRHTTGVLELGKESGGEFNPLTHNALS